jgi:hypothetical protein
MKLIKATLGWIGVILGILVIVWLPVLPAILLWIGILIMYALSFKLE